MERLCSLLDIRPDRARFYLVPDATNGAVDSRAAASEEGITMEELDPSKHEDKTMADTFFQQTRITVSFYALLRVSHSQ